MRHLIAITLALGLAGCATQASAPIIAPSVTSSLPFVQAVTLEPIVWGYDGALYTLDEGNYQSLVLNLIDLRRYLTEQRAIIDLLSSVPR